jgi:acid phosphatase (class A)
MKTPRVSYAAILAVLLLVSSAIPIATSKAHSPAVSSTNATFIDPISIDVAKILPPPPKANSAEARADNSYIKYSSAAATDNQKLLGIAASRDSVFDYSQTLGLWFNPKILPKTAALFQKVTNETKDAIELAKNHFKRIRPDMWKVTGDPEISDGYCYPSGHTTRAYVWSTLLANAFPDQRKALHLQARQKAWYRVILGRHYPSDVRAGKTYGTFLANKFLKDPAFQAAWTAACSEMKKARAEAIPPASFNP